MDLDDTLIPSEAIYRRCYAACDVNPDSPEFVAAKKDVKQLLPRRHVSSHNRLLYTKRYLERTGGFSAKTVLEMMHAYESTLVEEVARHWRELERPRLFATLSRKYRLILVTNETTRTQMLKLSAIDPSGTIFPTVVCSEDVGVEKPEQAIFLAAMERSVVAPEVCLAVGNNFATDLDPCIRMGMRAVLTVEFPCESEVPPVNILKICQLDQLLEVLEL